MADYKIEAVAAKVREFETKFGQMKSYKVKLSGEDEPVEISQKDSTPAPTVGETVTGTISETEYGKKFKKEFGGGFTGKASGFSGSKPSDPFTMYLSYAKDIAVARIAAGLEKRETIEVIDETIANAYILYGARPEVAAAKAADKAKVDEIFNTPEKSVFDEDEMPKDFLA